MGGWVLAKGGSLCGSGSVVVMWETVGCCWEGNQHVPA